MSTPPPVGKTLSVKVDQALYDDLVTIMRTGKTQTEAVRHIASVMASAYRNVWDSGRYPDGTEPDIEGFWIRPYDAGREPAQGPVEERRAPRTTPDHTRLTARPTPRTTAPPPSVTPPLPVRRSV